MTPKALSREMEITRVEFKCNICGKWEINPTGATFYKPTICEKCLLTKENK